MAFCCVHCLIQVRRSGDVSKVSVYIKGKRRMTKRIAMIIIMMYPYNCLFLNVVIYILYIPHTILDSAKHPFTLVYFYSGLPFLLGCHR